MGAQSFIAQETQYLLPENPSPHISGYYLPGCDWVTVTSFTVGSFPPWLFLVSATNSSTAGGIADQQARVQLVYQSS